jgi:hypothetical protein
MKTTARRSIPLSREQLRWCPHVVRYHPNTRGVLSVTVARSTGMHVVPLDADEAGFHGYIGEEDLQTRWATLCGEHQEHKWWDTLASARAARSHPEDWCDECERLPCNC